MCRITPQSHRVVRLLDRTIGCDWAKVRPIGNVCYDLQQRSHTAIDLYAWSRYHERLDNVDGKSIAGNRATSCSDQRPVYDQSIVASCDRWHEQSWPTVADRTSTRDILWRSVRSIVAPEDRWYNQSWDATIDRTINRNIVRPIVRSIDRTIIRGTKRFGIAGYKFWTWPSTLLRLICPLRSPTTSVCPVARPFYDLSNIPNCFGCRYVVTCP